LFPSEVERSWNFLLNMSSIEKESVKCLQIEYTLLYATLPRFGSRAPETASFYQLVTIGAFAAATELTALCSGPDLYPILYYSCSVCSAMDRVVRAAEVRAAQEARDGKLGYTNVELAWECVLAWRSGC
jgi:hypothetical protein